MTTIDISKLSKLEIVRIMAQTSTEETADLLFEIYYKFVTDQLDTDYLEQLGYRFNTDLEKRFVEYFANQADEEEE